MADQSSVSDRERMVRSGMSMNDTGMKCSLSPSSTSLEMRAAWVPLPSTSTRRFNRPRPRVTEKVPRVTDTQTSQINVAFSGKFAKSVNWLRPSRQYEAESETSIKTSIEATTILLSKRRKSIKLCCPYNPTESIAVTVATDNPAEN